MLCQFQIIFTMIRQTTSSAHVVLCDIPKDVHVPSLRKQLTFYDATTGFLDFQKSPSSDFIWRGTTQKRVGALEPIRVAPKDPWG